MDVKPQFTYDAMGNPIGVFLTMDQWGMISGQRPGDEISPVEKSILMQRKDEFRANPGDVIPWETLRSEFEQEDGAI